MFGLIKKMFVILLTSIASATNHTKCVLLSNQRTLIDLHPKRYSQQLRYYPLVVNLNRCNGSFNINDLFNRVCAPSETEDLNLHDFNMIITGNITGKLNQEH